ncbi:MAG: hypothetical protein LQ352_006457 [Teloschistes flavicans]|nr:MAG: hypothetical protein LQ352_006457 [Teloschistes flavicans]
MDLLPPLASNTSHAPPAFRRSATDPTRLNNSPRLPPTPASRETAGGLPETLYIHNAARIVSFTPPFIGARRHSSFNQGHSALQDEPVGTLPWASATERTIAAGSISIYKVLEVAFLTSGKHWAKPILSKSQCWCVDGESKFVLPIGPHTYYRIELPNSSIEDRAKVDDFKNTLGKILQYETTQCPFKRGFTVELPEKPQTPVRKKPWKPRDRPEPADHSKRIAGEPRTREKHRGIGAHPLDIEGVCERDHESSGGTEDSTPLGTPLGSEENSASDPEQQAGEDQDLTPTDYRLHNIQEFDPFKTPIRPRTLKNDRAMTAPPQLSLSTTPPSDITDASEEIASLSSSFDSFHSFHSPISPLPLSPRLSQSSLSPATEEDIGITMPKVRTHTRDNSELTVTADPNRLWDESEAPTHLGSLGSDAPEIPQTPPLDCDTTSPSEEPSPEAITPLPPLLRHRPKKSSQRPQSPLSPPANVYSPTSRLSGHHLTTAILQKTCSMLLGPPVSLVALMLNIAAKILDGTYNGFPFGHAESGRRIPCSWDFSDTDQASDDEDDYGYALDKLPSSRSSSRSRDIGGSWEVD